MYFAPVQRYLPRSRPGTGPTSKTDALLRAEVTQLTTHVQRLEQDQQIQLKRIAEIQRDLDEVRRLLKTIADR
jgi:hypothetical protein